MIVTCPLSVRDEEALTRIRSMPRQASFVSADDQTPILEPPRIEPEPEPMIVDRVERFAVPLPIPRLGLPRVPEMEVREFPETNSDSAASDSDTLQQPNIRSSRLTRLPEVRDANRSCRRIH